MFQQLKPESARHERALKLVSIAVHALALGWLLHAPEPSVWPWQLPASTGNEVIEITIDERGEITNKVVLHSLGADIDDKCLAALENWHFRPATRNGTPIPSKQDAIFPFRARG